MTSRETASCLDACLDDFCEAVLARRPDLAPYSRNYFQGHIRALGRTFPELRKQLGDDSFAALAQVYVTHYPPADWDINLYGEDFSELIAAQTRGTRASVAPWPELAALARREYAGCRAYYSLSGGLV